MKKLIIVGHGDHDEGSYKLNLNGKWKTDQLVDKLKKILENYSDISPFIMTAPYHYTVETGDNIASIFKKDTKALSFGELMWNEPIENIQKKFLNIFEIIEKVDIEQADKETTIIVPSSIIGTKDLLEFLCKKYLPEEQISLPVKGLWCGEFYFIDINQKKVEYWDREKITHLKNN
ncbi:MAG: hypothetical protein NDI62_03320 [Burkholderiales bacterium]|nr:hypothetical protein [Burkholderiales bacterium]